MSEPQHISIPLKRVMDKHGLSKQKQFANALEKCVAFENALKFLAISGVIGAEQLRAMAEFLRKEIEAMSEKEEGG